LNVLTEVSERIPCVISVDTLQTFPPTLASLTPDVLLLLYLAKQLDAKVHAIAWDKKRNRTHIFVVILPSLSK
jgi:hypothetical protein